MRESNAKGDEGREHLREQVFQSPALFGRLLALAELCNPVTGRYEHYLCGGLPDHGDSILRQLHAEVFAEWLNLGLEQQENDIQLWLRLLDRSPEEVADLLKRVEARASTLIPPQCRREPECELFLSDLRLVLGFDER